VEGAGVEGAGVQGVGVRGVGVEGAGVSGPPGGATGTVDAGFVLATYNIKSATLDRTALVGAVRALAPDVLLVQEAPNHLRWRSAAARLARETGLLHVAGGRPAGTNALFVRMRVGSVETWSRRWPTPPRDPVRGLVGAVLRVSGQLLGVVGAHYPLSPDARLRYGEQVVGAVAELGRRAPVVLLGADLNEDPGGPVWEQLTEAGLTDTAVSGAAREAADGRPRLLPAATYPASDPVHRIDTVWVSGAVTVLSAGVPAAVDTDVGALRAASDHLPWIVRASMAVT